MCCCLGAKKSVRKWVCKSFFRFLIRTVSGPFLVLKNDVWVRVGNTNNSTVLDFFKKLYKILFCFFWFFGQENHAKSHISVSKCSFQSPKRIFLVTKQNQWPGAPQGELETRNETKPYQRDELHPKCVFQNFETEF